jgi:hypothetical protein
MTNERQSQKKEGTQKTETTSVRRFAACAALATAWVMLCPSDARADAVAASLPSDTPTAFRPVTNAFDYVRREQMIPMRDGVS